MEDQEVAQRLHQFRRSLVELRRTTAADHGNGVSDEQRCTSIEDQPVQDPLIYPDLYSPSGFDVMDILIRVRTRPNPVIDVGNVDSSVSLVLCDAARPDCPIVYCSEAFTVLTGYNSAEIIGQNCRFLQFPPPFALPSQQGHQQQQHQHQQQQQTPTFALDPATQAINNPARALMREKTAKGEECRARFVNYRKSGERWENLLTTVPLVWDEGDTWKRYIVGFQADMKSLI